MTDMIGPEIDLVDILFGDDGVGYEPSATLGERVGALAEIVRRRFEKAGCVVSGDDTLLSEKVKQIVEKYESQQRGFLGTGGMFGKISKVDHGGLPN